MWNKTAFDGFPVIPVPVKCRNGSEQSSHDIVAEYLKAMFTRVMGAIVTEETETH